MSHTYDYGLVFQRMSLLGPVLERLRGTERLFCLSREQAEGAACYRERLAELAHPGSQ